MVICGPQKFKMAPQKIGRGPNMALKITDLGTTPSLHGRMYYLPKFEAYIKRWDPQFQWWDPHHIQSWVPRTPKHSLWCKTLPLWGACCELTAVKRWKREESSTNSSLFSLPASGAAGLRMGILNMAEECDAVCIRDMGPDTCNRHLEQHAL